MENKNERNENKIILGDFSCTMDKMERYGGKKTERLYRCCSNYAHIVGITAWGSMKKGQPRFPWLHRLWYVLWQGSRIDRVYTDIKTANNTKSNHIMVSFADHYNAISIDRLPSKTKIGKGSWCYNNSLLCKPKFSSATISF